MPKRFLLGEENMGFMYLMQNFKSERVIPSDCDIRGAATHARREASRTGAIASCPKDGRSASTGSTEDVGPVLRS